MVNTGRPSPGCQLCRKRRVKCDLRSPTCMRCEKYGKKCPGYRDIEELKFRVQRYDSPPDNVMKYNRLQWINSAPVLHDQLLSAFIHAYIPAPRNPYGHFDSDYMCLLPRRLGKSPLLDCGTVALCSAYIGQIHHDIELRKYGLQKYIEAVKGMRKRLPQLRSKEELLYLIAVLQTYESFAPSQDGIAGWSAHVRGCRAIISQGDILSEPVMQNSNMLKFLQMIFIAEALPNRASAHVSAPSWDQKTKSLFNVPLEMILECCRIIEEIKEIENARVLPPNDELGRTVQRLLLQCTALEERLQDGYDTVYSFIGPPEVCRLPTIGLTGAIEEIFQESFVFRSFGIAQLHSLYWAGKLFLYMCLERLYLVFGETTIQRYTFSDELDNSEVILSPRTLKDIIHLAGAAASSLCRSFKYHLHPSMNAFGVQVTYVQLWMVNEFYHERPDYVLESQWVGKVFKNTASRGFGAAHYYMDAHWPAPQPIYIGEYGDY